MQILLHTKKILLVHDIFVFHLRVSVTWWCINYPSELFRIFSEIIDSKGIACLARLGILN